MHTLDPAIFDELQGHLETHGSSTAIERLCTTLRTRKDYAGLFYALLLKKRHELGVSPVPTEPAQNLPPELHEPYEDAIREAGQLVGRLHLEEGDIPRAWMYYRMLGELGPVAAALETAQPAEGEAGQQLIEIAFHQGVHPRKGFDWILDRYGICSAITTVSGTEFADGDTRAYCIGRLVRALHEQLFQRLREEIAHREGSSPAGGTVKELVTGRDWLFEDEFYHVDVSHLGSVVQMSLHLSPGPELDLARDVCEYGQRLSPRFQYAGEPPFEDSYRDYGVYLAALAGDETEAGIAHFRTKAENADPETTGTLAAEALVNLLLRLDRTSEALAVARRYLTRADPQRLSCPTIAELCRRAQDYQTLAEVAREQGDPVHFLAGLLARNSRSKPHAV
jgi:hypothetical protein